MDKIADKLAQYVHDLTFEDLTGNAVHSVKRSLIDSLGCALASFRAEPIAALRRLASEFTAKAPATLIGTDLRTTPDFASFVNGGMVRFLDFSDDFFGGNGDVGPHPSDNISGILAAVESSNRSGPDLILGIALAYEACGQITEKIDFRGKKPTWDYPILHAISTCLGASKVLRLSRVQIEHALSLAVVSNVCLQQTRSGELSNWKGLAGPNASRNGLFAAYLANAGIAGPKAPFEGKSGLLAHLDLSLELGAFGGGEVPFKVEGTFFKSIPVRYSAQLPIWIAYELRGMVDVQDIHSIEVLVARRYATDPREHPEFWDPKTRETADHSFPFLIAAALVDGEVNEKTFATGRFRDAVILQLIQKVRLREDPAYSAAFPRTFNCRFDVMMKSGEMLSVHRTNPKGHPANPMSDQDIEDKFLDQAGAGGLTQLRSRALLDRLWSLEQLNDMAELFSLMHLNN